MDLEQAYESLNEFLITLIHTIFYIEDVYPEQTFKLVRQYDVAVRQNSHPDVQAWAEHAAAVLVDTIRAAPTRSVSFVVSVQSKPACKYVLDTSRLPRGGAATVDAARLYAEYRGAVSALLRVQRAAAPSTLAIAVNAEPTERLLAADSACVVADSHAARQWPAAVGLVEPVRFIDGGTFCMNVWREHST